MSISINPSRQAALMGQAVSGPNWNLYNLTAARALTTNPAIEQSVPNALACLTQVSQ
jgi:hypothetical protein